MIREKCRMWWASKQDAGHRERTEEWFERNAYELLCLFPHGGTLLDVGCGNAQLLTYLAPHFDEVIGIDYTPSMLEAAQRRLDAFGLKTVRLELGDACQFPPSVSRADVILSNQIAQNLDPEEVRLHVQECGRVLNPMGTIGICGIPWVNLKDIYRAGGLREPPPRPGLRQAIRSVRRRAALLRADWRGVVMADSIGRWYGRDQIRSIASTEGFDCHIVSAWYYEYRFHAKLTRCINAPNT